MVSSEKRKGEQDKKKAKVKGKRRGGVEGKGMTVPSYIFFFFLCSRPMSRHQTITLLSKASGSIDSIFSPSCCCDPETALWLDLDSQRENDGGNIKR